MQQVKIFTGLEGATGALTEEINDWIRDSGAEVLQISGNIAPQSAAGVEHSTTLPGSTGGTHHRPPSDILIIILYSKASK